MTPYEAAAQIRTGIGGDATGLTITGDDPVLPSIYRVGTATAASVGAATLGMSRLWQERGGPPPGATVHTRHAAVAFRSERYLRVNGAEPAMWADLSGDYPAAGGGWVRLHANYPNHRDAIVRALDVAADRAAVAAAVAGRSAVDVEDAVVAAGGAAAALRTCQEWANHPQAAAVAGLPPLPRRLVARRALAGPYRAMADRAGPRRRRAGHRRTERRRPTVHDGQ